MRTSAKVGLVVGGYVLAILLAWGTVAAYIALTDGPDRHASSGMYACSDSLMFLALCGVAAIPPTGGALYLARPYHAFWRALSVAALVITAPASQLLWGATFIEAAAFTAVALAWLIQTLK